MRLVHLSDIHHQLDWRRRPVWSTGWRGALGRFELHAMGRQGRFEGTEARLGQLLDDVHALSPAHVLLSGDLTALGHDEELGRVQELLAPLLRDGRLLLVPGNHDRYTDDTGRSRFERHFGSALRSDLPEVADERGYPYVRFLGASVALIGLDSTSVSGLTHYFLGKLGDAQLEALGRALDHPAMVDRTVLVMLHHGPLSPHGRLAWHGGLLDAKELMRVLAGRSVVLQHGHSHDRFWHRAVGDQPHIFGGGSSTELGRAGYWVVEVDDHRSLEGRKYLPGRRPVD